MKIITRGLKEGIERHANALHIYDIPLPSFQSLLLMVFASFCFTNFPFKLSTLFSHSVQFLYFEEREEWLQAVVRGQQA